MIDSMVITGSSGIEHAIALAFSNSPSRKATHFRIDPIGREYSQGYGDQKQVFRARVPRLVLGWNERMKDSSPLVHSVTAHDATALIIGWLTDSEYGPKYDDGGDGDSSKGWSIEARMGGIDSDSYAFMSVEPYWMYFSK